MTDRSEPRPRRTTALSILVVLALCLGACGDDAPDEGPADGSDASPSGPDADGARLAPNGPLDDQSAPQGTNGMAFDDEGRLWIADLHGGEILAVDPADGTVLVRFGEDRGVSSPDDLAFDGQGRLWWTDNEQGDVGRIDDPLAIDETSEVVASLGPGANPIAVSDDQTVFVARTLAADELYAIDGGSGEATLVRDAPGQLNGFGFGDDGLLYAPRFVDGTGRVSAVDPVTGEATDLVGGLPLPVGVSVAPDGTLRALTVGPPTVHSVDPDDATIEVVAELPGEVADNLAFDSDGVLWVSAFDRPVVWRIDPDAPEPVEVTIGS